MVSVLQYTPHAHSHNITNSHVPRHVSCDIAALFARYSKLTTYMSVAPIPLDIIIYVFFPIWKPWNV